MKYVIRMNKRIRDIRVYIIAQRLVKQENSLTKLFMKFFNPKKNERGPGAQINK